MYVMRGPQPTMLTNIEVDVLQERLPPGAFVARSAGSRNSFEMTSWYSQKTRQALGTQAALHVLTFCCFSAPPPTSICYFLKALGCFSPVFQQCPDLSCQRM